MADMRICCRACAAGVEGTACSWALKCAAAPAGPREHAHGKGLTAVLTSQLNRADDDDDDGGDKRA